MSATMEFRNVVRSYQPGKPVLDGVTFTMQPESVVALLGRNGAGKTTLVQIAMGMLFPHAGSVRVFGLSPTREPVAVKQRIGFVAEDQTLPPRSTLADLIALHRYLFPTWDVALQRSLMEQFGLDPASKVRQLSKGQARQFALLCAISHRPELLILDEPAGGLDPAARREFLETSIALLNREGTAILFSSHHMDDVERLGGRVLLLDEGKVRLDESVDALREAYCVAIVPGFAVSAGSMMERLPGCLRVRRVGVDWHGVFAGRADQVRAALQQALGLADVHCASVPLEELFIELVGGRPFAGAA